MTQLRIKVFVRTLICFRIEWVNPQGGNTQPQMTPSHFYKYRFWKDHYWIWILLIPIGFISWALPVVLFLGLNSSGMPLNAILLVDIVIGIPSYIGGCAFFTGLMQGISTRVTVNEDTITLKKPWFPFPFFTTIRRIRIADISQIKMSLGFGGGPITLFVHKNAGKKIRRILLPQFKDTDYLREMVAIKTRVEPPSLPVLPVTETPGQGPAAEPTSHPAGMKKPSFRMRPYSIENVLYTLISLGILGMAGFGGWITTTLPGKTIDAFSVGFSVGSICFFLAFCGFLPGVGQAAFWFLGHPVLKAIFWLLQVKGDEITWDTPPAVNQFLKPLNIPPIHSNLTEFIFWSVLVISIFISLNVIIGWFKRRAYKKFLKELK